MHFLAYFQATEGLAGPSDEAHSHLSPLGGCVDSQETGRIAEGAGRSQGLSAGEKRQKLGVSLAPARPARPCPQRGVGEGLTLPRPAPVVTRGWRLGSAGGVMPPLYLLFSPFPLGTCLLFPGPDAQSPAGLVFQVGPETPAEMR